MTSEHLGLVDAVLLVVSEARERAEGAAHRLRSVEGDRHLADALDEADRDLLRIHDELQQLVYFGAGSKQLEL